MVTTINSSNSLEEKSKNRKLPNGSQNNRLIPLQPVSVDSEQDNHAWYLPHTKRTNINRKTQQKSSGLTAGTEGCKGSMGLEHRTSSETQMIILILLRWRLSTAEMAES